MDAINLDLLALPSSKRRQLPDIRPPPRHTPGEKFLKGPIPWSWLEAAGNLPGKSIHVALAIWFSAGMAKNGTVRLPASLLRRMGVERNSMYRGLKQLEGDGLVSVVRHNGRSPIVTIIERKGE